MLLLRASDADAAACTRGGSGGLDGEDVDTVPMFPCLLLLSDTSAICDFAAFTWLVTTVVASADRIALLAISDFGVEGI